ncbi:MAG: tRNA (adenosine(37)-N6)-dimethylallyltransferase MiaA [Balneolales bacterium]|nr:tRNA (adenosine(37)-N6)-dimethylallyltransferase MiaA [Balneolales bacterium]
MGPTEKSPLRRIVIIGPTASGKSEVAANLAAQLRSVVISADSRQCYKKLNIGTAKPEGRLLKMVPHFYISELEPEESETAASFRRKTDKWESNWLSESQENEIKPVVYAGGSTLYLQNIIFDMDEVPPSNEENLLHLNKIADKKGVSALYEMLLKADPVYHDSISLNNRHRAIRALDVWMQTGRPFSSFHRNQDFSRARAGTMVIQLNLSRNLLYSRINRRVDQMLVAGLVDEVRDLLKIYSPDLQSLQTVGYREVIDYLKGNCSYDYMTEKIKTNTRRYAKRQLTWFRRWGCVHLMPLLDDTKDSYPYVVSEEIKKLIQDYESVS